MARSAPSPRGAAPVLLVVVAIVVAAVVGVSGVGGAAPVAVPVASPAGSPAPGPGRAGSRPVELVAPVRPAAVFVLPVAAPHVALHWSGAPDARVTVAFAVGSGRFGPAQPVLADEAAEGRTGSETYGAVMATGGADRLRVVADRPIDRVSVVVLPDDASHVDPLAAAGSPAGSPGGPTMPGAPAAAAVTKPAIISRAGWGADESLRFSGSTELWPRTYQRVQKLVVHHTATSNTYATAEEAKAQIRAIYAYHTVTLGWGDVGYHAFVDRFGNLYEGRYAGTDYLAENPPTPTGEDAGGRVVTAGHTYGYNTGTVGIAVLGTASTSAPPAATQQALVGWLAWEAGRHGLDPARTAQYRNLTNGATISGVPNVAEHRNFVATECPGGALSTLLNASGGLRDEVRARLVAALGTATGDLVAPPAPLSLAATGATGSITLSWPASTESWPAQSGVAFYELQRATSPTGSFAAVARTDDRTRRVVDRVRGTYSYRVVAVDAAGNRGRPSPVATARGA